eukprot:4662701-Amphidinium_carterae.1
MTSGIVGMDSLWKQPGVLLREMLQEPLSLPQNDPPRALRMTLERWQRQKHVLACPNHYVKGDLRQSFSMCKQDSVGSGDHVAATI